ncbi:hypothetical protein GCM10010531_01890 [Blastococcus jejuensis]|uniref:DUF6318 domain-containing protein n=1 Tax=Blastococcus jejuensis TaxID=351224 RepID=A0ABP6NP59_9ACTN
MARRWSLRLLIGVLAGVTLLSGCAEKQPANESLPSASASPTEEELPPLGPEDLPMPAEARTQDAAGAEAFVRYYIALINRTSDVMDAQPLREFSDGCEDCNRIASSTEEDAANGLHYEDGLLSITSMGEPRLEGDRAEIAFFADQARLQVVDAAGSVNEEMSSEAFADVSCGAAMRWNSELATWVMTVLTLG